MAYKLVRVGSKANSHICDFVADTYSDLVNIPDNDKTFGTKCLVVDTGRVYCLDSNLNWIPQKTKATLPDTTVSDEGKILSVNSNGNWSANTLPTELPTVSATDNGDVLTVVNGSWDKVTPQSNSLFWIDVEDLSQVIVDGATTFDGDPLYSYNGNLTDFGTNLNPKIILAKINGTYEAITQLSYVTIPADDPADYQSEFLVPIANTPMIYLNTGYDGFLIIAAEDASNFVAGTADDK